MPCLFCFPLPSSQREKEFHLGVVGAWIMKSFPHIPGAMGMHEFVAGGRRCCRELHVHAIASEHIRAFSQCAHHAAETWTGLPDVSSDGMQTNRVERAWPAPEALGYSSGGLGGGGGRVEAALHPAGLPDASLREEEP